MRREAELGGDFRDLARPVDRREIAVSTHSMSRYARGEKPVHMEEIVEARARQADLARELVHVEILVRPCAQERDRAGGCGCPRSASRGRRRRGMAAREIGLDDRKQQLLQHEIQALGGHEAIVQYFDGERVGETRMRGVIGSRGCEKGRIVAAEHRGKLALSQPVAACARRVAAGALWRFRRD